MSGMNVKKGDTVKVLSGKDKGKEGEVLRALPQQGARGGGEGQHDQEGHAPHAAEPAGRHLHHGGPHPRVQRAWSSAPSASKPTRTGKQAQREGKKVRVCKKCGKDIDK